MARTVKVPAELSALFDRAEDLVSAYFGRKVEAPERGHIEIQDERYVLVRASSLAVGFYDMMRDLYPGREEGRHAGGEESPLPPGPLHRQVRRPGGPPGAGARGSDGAALGGSGPLLPHRLGLRGDPPRVAPLVRRGLLPGLRPPVLLRVRELAEGGARLPPTHLLHERRVLLGLVRAELRHPARGGRDPVRGPGRCLLSLPDGPPDEDRGPGGALPGDEPGRAASGPAIRGPRRLRAGGARGPTGGVGGPGGPALRERAGRHPDPGERPHPAAEPERGQPAGGGPGERPG